MNTRSFLKQFVQVPFHTHLLLFVAGFVILALQLLGTRVLGSSVGTALPVWASLLSTTLAGSMLGYYFGGTLADKRGGKKMFIALVLCAGVLVMLVPELRPIAAWLVKLEFSYATSALLTSLVVLLPPTTLLAMLITYTIRTHVTNLENIAQVHGDLYTVATLGSIAGVFVTSYYLIPTYSVTLILYGLGALVIACGLFVVSRGRP